MKYAFWVILGLAGLGIGGWVGLWSGGDEGESGTTHGQARSPRKPPLIMQGVHLEEFQDTGKRLDLYAENARLSHDQNKIHLGDVRIRWTPPSEEKSPGWLELTGEKAAYDISDQIAVIREDVRILSADGHIMLTEAARYDHREKRIEGSGSVRMEGPEGWTEGVGLHVDMENEVVYLRRDVRTLFGPSAMDRAKEVLP